MIVIMTADC